MKYSTNGTTPTRAMVRILGRLVNSSARLRGRLGAFPPDGSCRSTAMKGRVRLLGQKREQFAQEQLGRGVHGRVLLSGHHRDAALRKRGVNRFGRLLEKGRTVA